MRQRTKHYRYRFLSFSVICLLYILIGGFLILINNFKPMDFILILLAILAIGVSILSMMQAIETDKMINTISLESYFQELPWEAGARMIDRANPGSHILASNIIKWVDEPYREANIRALNRGVYITRIFSFPPMSSTGAQSSLEEAINQSKWHPNITVLAYTGDDPLIDYCILEENGEPKSAVVWLHDPGHSGKALPGFYLENRRCLLPLWEDFKKKRDDVKTVRLSDYLS